MKTINTLSLFNGMNCIGLALKKMGISFNLYASEIDKHANKVSSALFPDTVNLGCVIWVRRAICWKDNTIYKFLNSPIISKANKDKFNKLLFLRQINFDLVVGGSPCQGFSFAGKQLNFKDPRSKLFFEFVKILDKIREKNPKVKFLLENVKMKKEFQKIISKCMGVEPIEINSALVSAQNRKRLYWTNLTPMFKKTLFGLPSPMIPQPKDRGILLKDILQTAVDEKYYIGEKQKDFILNSERLKKKYTQVNGEKALTMRARQFANWNGNYVCARQVGRKLIDGKRADDADIKAKQMLELREDNKTGTLTTVQKDNLILLVPEATKKGYCLFKDAKIRRLTPKECCHLQTIAAWAIEIILNCGVSDYQIYKMLGNGWTVEVIIYLLSFHYKN